MTAILTADWSPYGKNGYFRKVEVYEMGWVNDVNFDNAIIVPSRFGGPIAVIRDRTRPTRAAMKGIGKPIIGIYSSSGQHISSFVWNSGQLVRLGWSSTEELLCIQENGEVLIYSIFGKYIHAFRMGQEVEDTKVIDAQVFLSSIGTGVCVLTGAYRLFVTNTIKEPKVRKLAEVPGNMDLPNSWAVVHEDRQTYVLLSKGIDMYYVSEAQVIQKNINSGNEDRGCIVTDISVSPCYQHVALYNSQKQLWIGSSNLRQNYRLTNLQNSGRPSQLTWCGSNAIASYWDESVVIVGRTEDVLHYGYDQPVVLVPEIDCVRVISAFSTDIIQPVPNVMFELYSLNSTSPGSYLLEASKQFQKKSYRSNEYLHLVRSELATAINQCIEASSHEFKPENQKMLITAAKFGKTFAENFNPDEYVRMCRTLRVLNAVRDPKIGIFITYPQYEYLTLKNLLDRLVIRRYYYIAIQAANYMRLSNEDGSTRILEHWAYYKVSQEADQEQMAKEIANKLGRTSGVSFIDIAKKAKLHGKIKAAVKLIDNEPRAALQVELLLELDKYSEALQKAVDSGNADLISYVIITMKRKMPKKDFQMEVRNESSVYALYKKYCRERNEEALISIFKQEDDHIEMAACHLRNAYNPENFSMRNSLIESAKERYKKAKDEINMILCEEQKKLLAKQKEFQEKFKRTFIDLSLQDTIYKLLTLNEIRIAEELRCLYRISDRKYWWLRIKALAESKDWLELHRFSKLHKSPIGYEPFIDVCLKHGKENEARKYISEIREENKIDYLVRVKLFKEAVKVAELQRDVRGLEYIRINCNNSIGSEIDAALARLISPS